MNLTPLKPLLTRWPFLRLISVLLSSISIIMLGSILPVIEGNDIFYGDGLEDAFNCFPLAGNCLTVLYSGITLIVFLAKSNKNGKEERPWHPGADIAFDFLAWGLNWAMGILLFTWVGMDYDDPAWYCERDQFYSERDCSETKAVVGVQTTASILTLVVG